MYPVSRITGDGRAIYHVYPVSRTTCEERAECSRGWVGGRGGGLGPKGFKQLVRSHRCRGLLHNA